MKTRINQDLKLEISISLEDYHAIFYVFWSIADIFLTDEIPTACVYVPKTTMEKATLLLSETFWNGLTHRERLFVICHECMHVLLHHGMRDGKHVQGATNLLINVAQDITINEMIVDLFDFDRNDICNWEKYCWIDTCFKAPHLIKRNETFIYYLEQLINDIPDESILPKTVDEHVSSSESTEQIAIDDFIKTVIEELTPDELQSIGKVINGSNGVGYFSGIIDKILSKKVKSPKIQFVHIIRKLKKTSIKLKEHTQQSFSHIDRRFDDLISTSNNISLPGNREIIYPKHDKLLTAVFMDCSGSCISYFSTFEAVANALERESELFEIKLFVFDTKVTPVNRGDRVTVGGGTAFDIIEHTCLQLKVDMKRYPDCIIVITDGYGNNVSPLAPSHWVWLLTDDSTTTFISPESVSVKIKNVIF